MAETTETETGTTETKPKKSARPRRTKRKLVEDHARSYFDALARRDPDAMASHWSDDGVEELVPMTVLRGPAAIRGFFLELVTAVPDAETTVERLVADDRRAAVEWRMRGTFDGGP